MHSNRHTCTGGHKHKPGLPAADAEWHQGKRLARPARDVCLAQGAVRATSLLSPAASYQSISCSPFQIVYAYTTRGGARLSRRLSLTRDSNPGVHGCTVGGGGVGGYHPSGVFSSLLHSIQSLHLPPRRHVGNTHARTLPCAHSAPQTPPLERMTASGEEKKNLWLVAIFSSLLKRESGLKSGLTN